MTTDKMLFVFILSAMLCISMITGVFIEEKYKGKYDVNNDNVVNSEDLLELRKFLLEIEG